MAWQSCPWFWRLATFVEVCFLWWNLTKQWPSKRSTVRLHDDPLTDDGESSKQKLKACWLERRHILYLAVPFWWIDVNRDLAENIGFKLKMWLELECGSILASFVPVWADIASFSSTVNSLGVTPSQHHARSARLKQRIQGTGGNGTKKCIYSTVVLFCHKKICWHTWIYMVDSDVLSCVRCWFCFLLRESALLDWFCGWFVNVNWPAFNEKHDAVHDPQFVNGPKKDGDEFCIYLYTILCLFRNLER